MHNPLIGLWRPRVLGFSFKIHTVLSWSIYFMFFNEIAVLKGQSIAHCFILVLQVENTQNTLSIGSNMFKWRIQTSGNYRVEFYCYQVHRTQSH